MFPYYHMTEIIQKEARKTSPDPVQEALRGHKDTWNHEASLLIAQLIAFKRGLNGRGEPKVGLPPGSIKDPIPSEVGSYLDQLADRYNKLISDAHSIIEEQAHYSEGRNKGSKENGGQPVVASIDDEIMKIASWWGSRAKTYGKNSYVNPWYWFAAKEEVKIRMKLLKNLTNFTKQLTNIDSYIVSKDNKAIPNAIYEFDKMVSFFGQLVISNVEKLVKIDKTVLPESDEKTPELLKEINNEQKETGPKDNATIQPKIEEKIQSEELPINDFELSGEESAYAQGLGGKEMVSDLIFTGPISVIMQKLKYNEKFINSFKNDSAELRKKLDKYNLSGKGDLAEIQLSYGNLLKSSNSVLKLNAKNFSTQLKEIENLVNIKSAGISPEFQKLASSFMTRWLKRQKLKMMSNPEDKIRLIASDKIKIILKAIDHFQNTLENDEKSIDYILEELNSVASKISNLANTLFHLGKNHNDEYEQARLNGKTTTHLIKAETLNKLSKLKDYFAEALSKITA